MIRSGIGLISDGCHGPSVVDAVDGLIGNRAVGWLMSRWQPKYAVASEPGAGTGELAGSGIVCTFFGSDCVVIEAVVEATLVAAKKGIVDGMSLVMNPSSGI